MDTKLILLVLCATAASSRHLVDVNTYLVPFVPSPDTERHNSEIVLERRNIEYGSKTNLNGPNVQPLYRQESDVNRRIPERHTHRHHSHNHAVSESSDSNNNIGYTQDEYKLRTNVPSAGYTYTTEYMTSEMTIYTNIKPEINTRTSVTQETLSKETEREPGIDQYYRHGDIQNKHSTPITAKTNKNTIQNNNVQPNSNNDVTSPSDHNNLMHQNGIVNTNEPVSIRQNKPKTNQSGLPKISRTNETRPTTDRGKAIDNIPNRKEEEEEIGWVWGTEATDKETTTDKDDLTNRAAFSGDQCPTGKTKVEGMCVDKH